MMYITRKSISNLSHVFTIDNLKYFWLKSSSLE